MCALITEVTIWHSSTQPEKLLSVCSEKGNLIVGRVFGLLLNAALMLFSILANFLGENMSVCYTLV